MAKLLLAGRGPLVLSPALPPAVSTGGSAAVSNPGVAYVRTGGDDDTAQVGNPAKPFATGTAAFEAGARSFDFGVGSFDLITDGSGTALHVRGRGTQHTTVNLTHNGEDGDKGADGSAESGNADGGRGGDAQQTGNLTLSSDHSALIVLVARGGNGGDGGNGINHGNGGDGGHGGAWPIISMSGVIGTLYLETGAGGSGGMGSGDGMNGNSGEPGGSPGGGEAVFCNLTGNEMPFQARATIYNNVFFS